MKKSIVCTALLLANSILGMDGIEYLKEGWINSASVSPTNLALKLKPMFYPFSVALNGPLGTWRSSEEYVENDEAVILTPDQETWFIANSSRVMFTPVSFKSRHKGFRVTYWAIGAGALRTTPVITYIVLSGTPMEAGEDDVVMVMDNGQWVKAKDSKRLIMPSPSVSTA